MSEPASLNSQHLGWSIDNSEEEDNATSDYTDIGDAVLQLDLSLKDEPLDTPTNEKQQTISYYYAGIENETAKEPLLKFPSPKVKVSNHLHQPCLRAVFVWSLGLLTYLLLGYIVLIREDSLPQPRPSNISLSEFSEGRAVQHMQYLSTHIGPRPIGSFPNRQTVTYLLRFLSNIYNLTKDQPNRPKMGFAYHFSAGSTTEFNQQQKIDVGELRETRQNIYWDNLASLMILIEGQMGTNHSILISAHYDTTTLCPGAYDDASGVSVILELIVNLMNRPPLRHSVLFLLNNGHEFNLLGAKDFLMTDPLPARVDGFINLDASPGTKPILFRSSGGWMDEAFMRAAPQPHANVLSHDALENGILVQPSDYTVFNLRWPGLDFSFYSHRQIHHTLFDNFTQYKPGGLQFLGDNILSTILEICNSHILDWAPKSRDEKGYEEFIEPNVFYDVVGLFPVLYSRTISICVHIVVSAILVVGLGLLVFYEMKKYQLLLNKKNHPVKFLFLSIGSLVVSFIVGVLCALLVSLTLWWLNPMFYYPNAAFGLFAFGTPTLFGIILTQMVFERLSRGRGVTPSLAEKHAFWAITALWAIVMISTSFLSYGYGWTYPIFLFGLFSLFALIAHIINNKFWGYLKNRYNQKGVHCSNSKSLHNQQESPSSSRSPTSFLSLESTQEESNSSQQQREYFTKIKEKRQVFRSEVKTAPLLDLSSSSFVSKTAKTHSLDLLEDGEKSELQNFAQQTPSLNKHSSESTDNNVTKHEKENESFCQMKSQQNDKEFLSEPSSKKKTNTQQKKCSFGRTFCSFFIFLVGSFVPTLVLFDVSYFLVQFAGTQINPIIMALVVSVIVFISFLNFIPLTRRAGNFLLVILVLLCLSFTFIGIAIFVKPYTQQSPLTLNIRHHYFFNGSVISLSDSNSTLFVDDSYQDPRNRSIVDGESFLRIRTRFPYSISHILHRLNETRAKCNESINECLIPVDPPNVQLPSLNETTIQRNGTHLKVSVRGSSPGSFVLSLGFPSLKPDEVAVNRKHIVRTDFEGFFYIVNNDRSWRLEITWPLTTLNVPLVLRLNCDYNDIKFSHSMAQFVGRLLDWMSVEGEGNSLIRVTSFWYFQT